MLFPACKIRFSSGSTRPVFLCLKRENVHEIPGLLGFSTDACGEKCSPSSSLAQLTLRRRSFPWAAGAHGARGVVLRKSNHSSLCLGLAQGFRCTCAPQEVLRPKTYRDLWGFFLIPKINDLAGIMRWFFRGKTSSFPWQNCV